MIKAIWNNQILAESKKIKELDGNTYFPPDTVKKKYFKKSFTHYVCPWKGTANFYNIAVEGNVYWNAAWYYPNPNKDAGVIRNYIAFSKNVELVKE